MPVGTYPVENLAAFVDSALPDGVQVYAHAADIGKLPAVVFVPGDPAIVVTTMSGNAFVLGWGIEVTLVTSRSQVKYGTRAIVDLWRQVAVACNDYTEAVQVLTLEEIGEIEWSGGTAIAGTMPLILTQSEGT
jgi:hypothetical protein